MTGAEDHTDVVGRRIGAGLLDLAVAIAILILVGVIFGQAHAGGSSASVNLHGASVLVWALLVAAYYFISEWLTGRTLGKALLGLRVVSGAGTSPAGGAVAIRTLLRVIDFLPAFYLLGLVVILVTGQRRKRRGDLAAGTTVVRPSGR